MSELPRVTALLDEFWLTLDLHPDLQADLNIAVEEILSNVIRHGCSGDQSITMCVAANGEQVRIEIQDSGVEFNPLTHPLPDPKAPLEQRRPGGLGILMVVKMMDQVSYERRENRNCCTMKKSILGRK